MPLIETQVGAQNVGDGANVVARAGQQGDTIVSQLHGRYYEQCLRGNLWCYGVSRVTLVTQNAIATGVTATAQPIIAIWNGAGDKNLVILEAIVQTADIVANTAGPGGLMWVYSNNNNNISTGSNPINLKTLSTTGSIARAFSVNTALTGLTNNLAVLRAAGMQTINAATPVNTPVGTSAVEAVNGSIIVPPLSVVGIMCQISSVAVAVSTSLLWEEIPING